MIHASSSKLGLRNTRNHSKNAESCILQSSKIKRLLCIYVYESLISRGCFGVSIEIGGCEFGKTRGCPLSKKGGCSFAVGT